jgi:hypothetical protein
MEILIVNKKLKIESMSFSSQCTIFKTLLYVCWGSNFIVDRDVMHSDANRTLLITHENVGKLRFFPLLSQTSCFGASVVPNS